jgi:hypothetical protein
MKNDWDCSSTDSDLARESGHFLAGCTTAATSTRLPTGLEDVEPFEIEDLTNARAYFGVILFGQTAEAADKFLEYLKDGFWKDVRNMIDWIPVLGSTLNFFEAVAACINKSPPTVGQEGEEPQKCDPMGLVIAGVGIIADVATSLVVVFKPLQALFKASRLGKLVSRSANAVNQGVGSIARFMSDFATRFIQAGAASFESFKSQIDELIAPIVNGFRECGKNCANEFDDIAAASFRTQGSKVLGAKYFSAAISKAKQFGISIVCFTQKFTARLGSSFNAENIFEVLFGISSSLRSSKRDTRAGTGNTRDCKNNKNVRSRQMNEKDPNFNFKDDYYGGNDLDFGGVGYYLEAHHMVPLNVSEADRCEDLITRFDYCKGLRAIFLKIATLSSEKDKSINNYKNQVMLPPPDADFSDEAINKDGKIKTDDHRDRLKKYRDSPKTANALKHIVAKLSDVLHMLGYYEIMFNKHVSIIQQVSGIKLSGLSQSQFETELAKIDSLTINVRFRLTSCYFEGLFVIGQQHLNGKYFIEGRSAIPTWNMARCGILI